MRGMKNRGVLKPMMINEVSVRNPSTSTIRKFIRKVTSEMLKSSEKRFKIRPV